MLPEEVYKRRKRHNNTPKSTLLIIANYIVVLVCASLFTSCNKINWIFWVVIAGMAVYNFFDIRRYHDEYNKPTIIAYISSLVILIGVFIYYLTKGQGC